MPQICPKVIGEVWGFVRARPEIKTGCNISVYLCDAPDPFGIDESTGLFGVEVGGKFEGDGHVTCVELPACRVIWTEHYGPYQQLNKPHETIHAWLKNHPEITPAGRFWEIYGHWTDDPAKLLTEVYYELKDAE